MTVKELKDIENKKTEKKKLSFNFDFLQKLGKVLMAVIAVMPAAGLMISIGKLISMSAGDIGFLLSVGSADIISKRVVTPEVLSFAVCLFAGPNIIRNSRT